MATTKTLGDVRRGDRIETPKGVLTVTNFTINWKESFKSKGPAHETATITGTVGTSRLTFTLPALTSVEVL